MISRHSIFAVIAFLGGSVATADILANSPAPPASTITIEDELELREVLRTLADRTTLLLSPGIYGGGYHVTGIADLTIEALDPSNPPVFEGGKTAWQFSQCPRLTLRHLRIRKFSENGLNLDDGGKYDQPVPGITLDHIEVSDIGPTGNHDGIKCSGLEGFTIRECTFSGWGGQGIDLVGCHRSVITGCRFIGKEGYTASAGVQIKGGSSGITVEKCHFVSGGQRPINIGGSTGLEYFRPPGTLYEAAGIRVRENIIEGSQCAAAFVGVDGAEFVGNVILFPEKWIFRILQETTEPGFISCRNVAVKDNRVVFRRADVHTDINIGAGTAPESFHFEGNHWYAEDSPDRSKPVLPVAEVSGRYGEDPRPK
jgi:Right handed beta helix region